MGILIIFYPFLFFWKEIKSFSSKNKLG